MNTPCKTNPANCTLGLPLGKILDMMNTQKRNQFIVREVRAPGELALCADLDHSFQTEFVWQMDVREEAEGIGVRFRTVRLPRSMEVAYPRDSRQLRQSWATRDCFLVACVDELILGYVNMRVNPAGTTGLVHDLVVHAPLRHRRIGSALLDQATRWARLKKLGQLSIEMQTKNFPAISFVQKHGFGFCGYNDHYYPNQDIALFFSKNL